MPHAKERKGRKAEGARRFHQASGLTEISRGLSVAIPPERVAEKLHSEGVPEIFANMMTTNSLRPLQGLDRCRMAGGVARKLAQPPANFWQPSGLNPFAPFA